ncbi:MAG: DUF424 domain-containing protein [Thermoplasmatota archaeon]
MKMHRAGDQFILAACDRELLGTTIKRNDLDFKVSSYFYGGDLVSDETFLNMVSQVKNANIVGNHCIGLLIEKGLILSDSVVSLDGVGHVQIYDITRETGY